MTKTITTAEEREPECEPCATRHPADGHTRHCCGVDCCGLEWE